MSNLEELWLKDNELSGPIPPELGGLSRLRVLALGFNELTGSIPPELGELSNLEELRLWHNQLTGTVSLALEAFCEELSILRLAGNELESVGLVSDAAALLSARDVLAGDAVLNWDEREPIALWEGIKLAGELPRVVELNLLDKGLNGRIPAALGQLDKLVSLRLHRNRLSGSIPPELGGMDQLHWLSLNHNRLTGSIPPELGGMDQLHWLSLNHNRLTGSIPPELGGMDQLHSLSLNHNRLSGSIPPELGELSNLEELWLKDNELSGPIPPELGGLSRLRVLALGFNELSGSIPPELGELSNLEELWLKDNELGGSIPPEINALDNLSILRLAGNELESVGLVSDAAALLSARDVLAGDAVLNWDEREPIALWEGIKLAGELPRVVELNLLDKGLNGRIPAALGQLDKLVSLRLHHNRLTGSIPPELGELSNLEELWLKDNELSGPIPPELGGLSRLRVLALGFNELTGSIPPELGELSNLEELRLWHNQLTGTVSLALEAFCEELSILRLAGNELESVGLVSDAAALLSARDVLAGDAVLNWDEREPIALWEGIKLAGELPRVVELNLLDKGLNGRIPAALGQLDKLVSLRLHHNRLTGSIPPELGELSNLEELWLKDNELSGPIPPELGGLSRLRVLALGFNELTGSIPPELGELSNLEELRLWHNQLTGTVSLALEAFCEELSILRLAGNELESVGLVSDAAALLSARDVLAGDAVLNWDEREPIALWEGIKLAGELPRVVELNLLDKGLNGRIPAALGQLDKLVSLRLHHNRLTGSIPPELGRLDQLHSLSLHHNRLSGSIPPEINALDNLSILRLAGNNFSNAVNDFTRAKPPVTVSVPLEREEISEVVEVSQGETADYELTGKRSLLWRMGLDMFLESPIIGNGVGRLYYMDGTPVGYHHGRPLGVHNLYLLLAGEAGIVPLSLYLLFLFSLMRLHWTAPSSLARDSIVGWAIVMALYNMAFQHLLSIGAHMFLFGLSCALASAVRRDSERDKKISAK